MNPITVLADLEQACKDAANAVIESPAVAADVEQLVADLLGNTSKPQGLFNALPVLGRLRLTAKDHADMAAFAASCSTVLAAGPNAGSINWCNVVKSAEAVIAELTAAGLAIPAWATLVVAVLGGLCPASRKG